MSFVSSKKKLSYKSAAHLKDGIHKVSEFSLTDVGESNVQFVNVGSKLLILPVYDEWNFFGETLDVHELHCDGTVVKQNIMPPSIIKQCFQCRFFPTLVVVNHRNQLYQKNMKITLEILNLLNMDLGFVEYSFDFDYECTYIKVFQNFNYLVVSTERSRKKCFPNFILILEMKKIEEQRYELIEVNIRLSIRKLLGKSRIRARGNKITPFIF